MEFQSPWYGWHRNEKKKKNAGDRKIMRFMQTQLTEK